MSRRHPVASRAAAAEGRVEPRFRHGAALLAIFLSIVLLAGCGGGEEAPPEERPATTGEEEDVSPLSREQLELQAEAMSPEVAESLGIVDTTIRVSRPVPPESVLLPGTGFDSLPGY